MIPWKPQCYKNVEYRVVYDMFIFLNYYFCYIFIRIHTCFVDLRGSHTLVSKEQRVVQKPWVADTWQMGMTLLGLFKELRVASWKGHFVRFLLW